MTEPLIPVAPEVPPPGLREALREMTLAYHTFNGRCTTDLPSCQSTLCVGAKQALAATRTPEPPDSGDGGIDAALLAEALQATPHGSHWSQPQGALRHETNVPWLDIPVRERTRLIDEARAVLDAAARLRSGSPTPEGGE